MMSSIVIRYSYRYATQNTALHDSEHMEIMYNGRAEEVFIAYFMMALYFYRAQLHTETNVEKVFSYNRV